MYIYIYIYINIKKIVDYIKNMCINMKGNFPLRLNMVIISDSEQCSTVRENIQKVILKAAGIFKIKNGLRTFCIMG